MSPFVMGKFEESIKLTNLAIEYINIKHYLKLREIISSNCTFNGISSIITGKDASIKAIQENTKNSKIDVTEILNLKSKCIIQFKLINLQNNTTKRYLVIIETKEDLIESINVFTK